MAAVPEEQVKSEKTMAKKKSSAQIRRAKKRAAERGEEYVVPPIIEEDGSQSSEAKAAKSKSENTPDTEKKEARDSKNTTLIKAAIKLKKELDEIQKDESLRAKERRSNKRKAEAIAAESAGTTVEEMQKWYEENLELLNSMAKEGSMKKAKGVEEGDQKPTPYIVFVGQLAFSTTKEGLFEHIKKELGSEHKVTQETVKIRLLTDPKTKKSRGMAFVELQDPETMYACLKLHHTMLDARRINVERSAGGSKSTRQTKIKKFREQQQEYLANVVDSILGDYIKTGELKEGELDEGCVALCKRHTATLVEAALKQYIENNGRTMDNPSAYFTFLLTKLATEGVWDHGDKDGGKNKDKKEKDKFQPPPKKPRTSVSSKSSLKGVEFPLSEGAVKKSNNMSDIFPSLSGGRRGRGRGYM